MARRAKARRPRRRRVSSSKSAKRELLPNAEKNRRMYPHLLDRHESYEQAKALADKSIDDIGESIIDEMRIQFKEQFPGGENDSYNFTDFLGQSVQTLQWRIDEDIPEKLKKGIMDKEDAEAAMEIAATARDAIKRRLSKGLVSLGNLVLPGDSKFRI